MKRRLELDGVRGLAIALVVVSHYLYLQWDAPSGVEAYIRQAFRLTWSGVDLFFVLSGFLIVGILLDHRESEGYFRTFYLRRACRIVPVYACFLGAFFGVRQFSGIDSEWITAMGGDWWLYPLLIQNFHMAFHGLSSHWLAPSWSLAIEEQFYLLVPFLVWFFNRKALLVVVISLILLAPLFRTLHGEGSYASFFLPWCRADGLMMGALLAIAVRTPVVASFFERKPGVLVVGFLGMSPLIVVLMVFHHTPGGIWNHSLFSAWYGLLLLIAYYQSNRFASRLLRSPFLVWLGLRSYALYLIHQPVSGLLHYGILRQDPVLHSPVAIGVTGLALVVSLLLCEGSYRFLETPVLKWGHRFRYGGKK